MRLTVIGSGDAFHGTGANASYCLENRLLVDCGAPVHRLGPPLGISVAGISTLLVTHFHFDHCGQAPMLLGARALADENTTAGPAPLRLAGPPGTREYLLRLLEVGYGSTLRRLIEERLVLQATVLGDGDDVELDGFRIRAHAVVHSTGPSLAYAVTGEGGVTVGFSGDSSDCAGLWRCAAQADLMVCECTGWDAPVPSHLWAGEVRRLVDDNPTTRFLLSHLGERRPFPGALLAHDGLTLGLSPADAPAPQPPPSLV